MDDDKYRKFMVVMFCLILSYFLCYLIPQMIISLIFR